MSQAPAMPLFCDAYLADTMHLSLEEHGAYLKLLMITWRNNGKPLPDDDGRLARMLGITPAKWRTKLRPVLAPFFDLSEGAWRQKRLEKEWRISQKISEAQREKAKSRWNINSLRNNDSSDAAADAAGMPEGMPPDPDPVREERDGGGSARAHAREAAADHATPQDAPRIATHFLAERDRLWPGNPNLPSPTITLETQAREFLNHANATLGLVTGEITRVMEALRSKGDPNPPTNLRFCSRSLMSRIANGDDHGIADTGHGQRTPRGNGSRGSRSRPGSIVAVTRELMAEAESRGDG